MGKPIGFRAPLADINGEDLNALVGSAWTHRAPRQLVATVAATAGRSGDLPASIGKPPTRALSEAGLTTLKQVATRTKAELLALHGVAPRAVRIISEALAEKGMSLR